MNKIIKIFIICIFFLTAQFAKAETIQGGVEFEWVNLSQKERNELVEKYKNIAINTRGLNFEGTGIKTHLKDQAHFETAGKIKAGIEEDENKFIAGFYRGGLLLAYGIVEKNNLRNAYYYDLFGNLRYVDYLEKDYGKYPCVSYQYNKKGKLIAKVYNLNKYDQFMYAPDGEFLGRWYQNTLYNQNGKATMGRSWF